MSQDSPYGELPAQAFWKTGVVQATTQLPEQIYCKKFLINKTDKIVTAGSCFAQHVGRVLRQRGFSVVDREPPPPELPEWRHRLYGFSMYSARYGNIYTTLQLYQLVKEAFRVRPKKPLVWKKNGRYFDALRPTIEPNGYASIDELTEHRRLHLDEVRQCFLEMDVFVFTLGLTEAWQHRRSGRVVPVAPGVIAGSYDEGRYRFLNLGVRRNLKIFRRFLNFLGRHRDGLPQPRILLTVSPVPLTASASGQHVLVANTYSKAVLRVVAAELAHSSPFIDYLPSYELVTNPATISQGYGANLRSVSDYGVSRAMGCFVSEHDSEGALLTDSSSAQFPHVTHDLNSDQSAAMAIACEEELLDLPGRLP